jgi:hypothetical protein
LLPSKENKKMIEIFSIYFQLLVFLIIFQFPFNSKILNTFQNIKFNYFEIISFNIIFHFIFYLIISFFLFDLKIYFLFELSLGLVFLIYNLKNINFKKIFNDNLFIIIFFLILNFILFTNIATNLRLEWDGLDHWIYKAQIYFQGGTFGDIKNVEFSYYPQLGSFIWGYFWKNSILEIEYFGRLIFPFIFLVGIFLSTSKFEGKNQFVKSFLIPILLITLCLDHYLFGGYQDYLLFFLLLTFSKVFYQFRKSKSKFLFIVLILNTILILWTKQEGFFYNIILTIVFIFFSNSNHKNKFIFVSFVGLSLLSQIVLKNYFIGSFNFNEDIIHNELFRYLNILEFLSTFFLITKHILISMVRYPIWILIIVVMTYIYFKNKKNLLNYSFFYFLIFMAFVYAIYFQTTMDLEYLLPITVDRILLQGSGFLLYPTVIHLERIISSKK